MGLYSKKFVDDYHTVLSQTPVTQCRIHLSLICFRKALHFGLHDDDISPYVNFNKSNTLMSKMRAENGIV